MEGDNLYGRGTTDCLGMFLGEGGRLGFDFDSRGSCVDQNQGPKIPEDTRDPETNSK